MHECKRCGYSTPFKYNLTTHLQRKNWCSPDLEDINPSVLLAETVTKENTYKCDIQPRSL